MIRFRQWLVFSAAIAIVNGGGVYNKQVQSGQLQSQAHAPGFMLPSASRTETNERCVKYAIAATLDFRMKKGRRAKACRRYLS